MTTRQSLSRILILLAIAERSTAFSVADSRIYRRASARVVHDHKRHRASLQRVPAVRSPSQHEPAARPNLRVVGCFSRSFPTLLSGATSQDADSTAQQGDDDDDDDDHDDASEEPSTFLDRSLSRLTQGFPLYVLMAALAGVYRPSLLTWVNRGSLISVLLASVMCGTGLTLQAEDFSRIPPSLVAFGVACQFLVMPLAAFTVASAWLKPYPDLFLGLCLVGCSPGGTASNLVSLIANADVALSVVLTACSTLLAVVVTPALVQLLTRSTVSGAIRISGIALVQATAKVVFAPVLLGMLLKAKAPRAADSISRFTPFCSAVLVALICGGVVAQNTVELRAGPAASLLPDVVRSVLALHGLGFALGYVLPARLLRRRQGGGAAELRRTARTVSIEVGMQNSALAVVLARSITSNPAAALPGALSATAHSCLGSLLAAVWRSQDERDRNKRVRPGKGARAETFPEIRPSYGEDDPEFAI